MAEDRPRIAGRRAFGAGFALAAAPLLSSAAHAAGQPLFSVPQTFIPIVGSDQVFPVRRVYCIGRNYAAHAREMGSATQLAWT